MRPDPEISRFSFHETIAHVYYIAKRMRHALTTPLQLMATPHMRSEGKHVQGVTMFTWPRRPTCGSVINCNVRIARAERQSSRKPHLSAKVKAVADLEFGKRGFKYAIKAIKARIGSLLGGSMGMPPPQGFSDLLRSFLVYSWGEIASSETTLVALVSTP